MYKIGLSSCGKEICEDLFRNYKKAGISAMEISTDEEKYSALNYKEIFSLSKKYEINL